ncbi:hypothetical protein [Streptomyces spiramenti]|uniref:Uncharacterized protein n=1 Tax=Streptomyces spiramenti TaxID=2720606 RepID=A0ABX1AQ59_9ACTN|nr:hypothetical protein [Streptomyces spiramenti]NJP68440.1 hypothetical protein [Streptomyces spiramenti]
MTTSLLDAALVEETAKKSSLLWVRGPGPAPARALWHAWHEGAVWLVGGPGEQPLEGLELRDGGTATVTARSKDNGGRLLVWTARVGEPAAGGPEWAAAVAELRGKRLNAPDADRLADRWAAECRVLRLTAEGPAAQRPGAYPTGSGAEPPRESAALTRGRVPSGLPVARGRR